MNKSILMLSLNSAAQKNKTQGMETDGAESPESVAGHSLRAAQIGFVLAKLEDYSNRQKSAQCLFFRIWENAELATFIRLPTGMFWLMKKKQ